MAIETRPSFLVDFVNRYQVCWEVWPEYLMVEGKERQVGFELELSGTHELGTGHVSPGCPACRQIYGALRAIAEWIFPKEERPSMYEIGPYEQVLRYSAVRGNRPDVTLSVKIVHRRGFDQPVDDCETASPPSPRFTSELIDLMKRKRACHSRGALL